MSIKINIDSVNLTNLKNRDAVLSALGEYAILKNWAKPGFCQALIERENEFPTGLRTKSIGVAIPHADPNWVKDYAVIFGFLENEVLFNLMDNVKKVVEVQLVILLSLPSEKNHMHLLSSLVKLISNKNSLEEIYGNRNKKRIIEILSSITDDVQFI